MKNKYLGFIFFVIAGLMFAYYYSRKVIQSYGYTVGNIIFKEFTINKIAGHFTVNINNLKLPDFILEKVVLKIYVNDVFIDEVIQNQSTKAVNGNLDVKLYFDINPKNLLNLQSLNLVLRKSKTVRYTGYAVINKFFNFKIPIEYKYTLG